jgi:hypothetical protein
MLNTLSHKGNATQNYAKIPSRKQTTTTNAGENAHRWVAGWGIRR